MERPARIAIAGGGTGGHVFPALGIADALKAKAPGTEFLFFGTANKIEASVVPQHGYAFQSIWISGFHRSLRTSNLLFPVKVPVSVVQSWRALRRFKPDVVVGTGGYICGPVLYAASVMGIPTVMHESNSYPGVTTRLLAGRLDLVLVGFQETKNYLKNAARVEVVGTPVRNFGTTPTKDEARRKLSLSGDDRVVLIVGGSQGSRSLNNAVAEGARVLEASGVTVVWQTGVAHEKDLQDRYGGLKSLRITGFIDDMATAYASADLVVSRSGASTLAELALLGKPAVLVPYPYAAGDHQMKNARTVEKAGGAIVVPDGEVAGRLVTEITRLMGDADGRERMSTAMASLAVPQAASVIAGNILSTIQ